MLIMFNSLNEEGESLAELVKACREPCLPCLSAKSVDSKRHRRVRAVYGTSTSWMGKVSLDDRPSLQPPWKIKLIRLMLVALTEMKYFVVSLLSAFQSWRLTLRKELHMG